MGLWYGFKWKELALTALPVVILSLAFPQEPLIPFIAGCAGLAMLCARTRGEGREWLEATWTLGKQIFPLLVVGANSIFIYSIDQVLRGWLSRAVGVFTFRFEWLGDFATVAQSCTVLLVMWAMCYWLYRRKIFFKL